MTPVGAWRLYHNLCRYTHCSSRTCRPSVQSSRELMAGQLRTSQTFYSSTTGTNSESKVSMLSGAHFAPDKTAHPIPCCSAINFLAGNRTVGKRSNRWMSPKFCHVSQRPRAKSLEEAAEKQPVHIRTEDEFMHAPEQWACIFLHTRSVSTH